MLARFDHRPMLTAVLALATIVLLAVVMTLSTLLITSPQAASPPSNSGGNPAAPAPKVMGAGGENYGWNVQTEPAQTGDGGERHAKAVLDYGNHRNPR